MGLFSGRKPHSGLVAKERLSNLLMAERLNCSPASLQMLKNDLSAAAGKWHSLSVKFFRNTININKNSLESISRLIHEIAETETEIYNSIINKFRE